MAARIMPHALCAALVAFAAVPSWAAAPQAGSDGTRCASSDTRSDPIALYGPEARYAVVRNGERIGSHRVTFEQRGDTLIANSTANISVRVLAIPAYRFTYQSTDVWRDGCLVAMSTAVDDNGERTSIRAERQGPSLKITGPTGVVSASTSLFPTNHWDAAVLNASQVLDTLRGIVADVRILDRGRETIAVGGDRREARRYEYTGDVQINVWYDEAGRWLKMRFTAKDGSPVEYICETCGRGGGRA